MCWFTNAKIMPFEDQPNGMRPNSQLRFIRLSTFLRAYVERFGIKVESNCSRICVLTCFA